MEKKRTRVSIFIDGRNFYHSTRNIEKRGHKIEFQKIISRLVGNRELINVFYYNALLDKDYDLQRYERHNEFLNSLKKIPKFKVMLCDWRKITNNDGSVRYDIKGDDVYLTHDLLIGAFDNLYDAAIIISGDADFIPVIKTVRGRFKKKVGNGYFRSSSSYKLRKACDFSINLYKVIFKILDKKKQKASVLSEDNTVQVWFYRMIENL